MLYALPSPLLLIPVPSTPVPLPLPSPSPDPTLARKPSATRPRALRHQLPPPPPPAAPSAPAESYLDQVYEYLSDDRHHFDNLFHYAAPDAALPPVSRPLSPVSSASSSTTATAASSPARSTGSSRRAPRRDRIQDILEDIFEMQLLSDTLLGLDDDADHHADESDMDHEDSDSDCESDDVYSNDGDTRVSTDTTLLDPTILRQATKDVAAAAIVPPVNRRSSNRWSALSTDTSSDDFYDCHSIGSDFGETVAAVRTAPPKPQQTEQQHTRAAESKPSRAAFRMSATNLAHTAAAALLASVKPRRPSSTIFSGASLNPQSQQQQQQQQQPQLLAVPRAAPHKMFFISETEDDPSTASSHPCSPWIGGAAGAESGSDSCYSRPAFSRAGSPAPIPRPATAPIYTHAAVSASSIIRAYEESVPENPYHAAAPKADARVLPKKRYPQTMPAVVLPAPAPGSIRAAQQKQQERGEQAGLHIRRSIRRRLREFSSFMALPSAAAVPSSSSAPPASNEPSLAPLRAATPAGAM